MNKKLRIGFVVLCSILLFSSMTSADWVQDNGSLNIDTAQSATSPKISIANSTPYVAWPEIYGSPFSDIFVKRWNGAAWVAVGGSLNVDTNRAAQQLSLFVSNTTPYATWQEMTVSATQVYVKHWNGASWVQDGTGLNIDPGEISYGPSISLYNGTPWVAWAENLTGRKIYVKRWNGAAWVQVGSGSLNFDVNASAYEPRLDIYNGTPYVAWHEYSATPPNATQIYVKRWNGAAWLSNGGSLNVDVNRNAGSPSLDVYNGTPYVAWFENTATTTQIYVKRWNGAAWLSNGGSLNVDVNQNAQLPSLYLYNGTPYVAWNEISATANNRIYVKQWNGSAWVQLGGSLNVLANQDARRPSLYFDNDKPYVTWDEDNVSAVNQIYVKHYDSPTFTVTPTFTPTRTVTRTYTPTATITSSITSTPSITPTRSATPTFTQSPTSTQTPVYTATFTPTVTPTASWTRTFTPTTTATSAVSSVDLGGREVIAYPNPARQSMRFILNLGQSELIKVEIYNAAGERVATLSETLNGIGAYLTWNCVDQARGTYIARVFKGSEELATLKVALVK